MYWERAIFLARRDGGYFCRYCGVALIPPVSEPQYILPNPDAVKGTIDHLTPLNRGGHSGFGNLGLSCLPCNEDKGNLMEHEYKRMMRREG